MNRPAMDESIGLPITGIYKLRENPAAASEKR